MGTAPFSRRPPGGTGPAGGRVRCTDGAEAAEQRDRPNAGATPDARHRTPTHRHADGMARVRWAWMGGRRPRADGRDRRGAVARTGLGWRGGPLGDGRDRGPSRPPDGGTDGVEARLDGSAAGSLPDRGAAASTRWTSPEAGVRRRRIRGRVGRTVAGRVRATRRRAAAERGGRGARRVPLRRGGTAPPTARTAGRAPGGTSAAGISAPRAPRGGRPPP